jgi:putative ABC transport system substrate-binding protein
MADRSSDAQTSTGLPRVLMITGIPEIARPLVESFREGMRQSGQVEGQTFHFEVQYGSDAARLPALLREGVAQRPAVLVVTGLSAARHARDVTTTVPVVVATASDLVDAGVVKSLAHPGGNITGVSDSTDGTTIKRFELLKAALPAASRVVLLVNPDFPATARIEARVQSAASSLKISVMRLYARDDASLALALDSMREARPDAVLVGGDPLFNRYAGEIIDAALAVGVPVFHYWPGTAERGALLSFQVDQQENFRRAAGYVDKILKGAKPGDLPIHQPTRFELVVNAKVARALGITLPQDVLVRAERIID